MSDLLTVILLVLLAVSVYRLGVEDGCWIERYLHGEEDDGRPF